MKASLVSRALAVIGIVALSVTAVHAGHGQGGGIQDEQGYVCYLVEGEDTGFVVDIVDNSTTPSTTFTERTGVRLGRSRLICVGVTVHLVSRPDQAATGLVFNNTLGAGAPVLQCHNMVDTGNNPAVIASVTGAADAGTFALQSARYVCLDGNITSPP